jgi:FtsH-binding integral membrane protein
MSWEQRVRTGDQGRDWQQAQQLKSQAEAQGMIAEIQPLPHGGLVVRGILKNGPSYNTLPPPATANPPVGKQSYPSLPPAPLMPAFSAMPSSASGAPMASVDTMMSTKDVPLGEVRVRYLRKVYSYLLAACFMGIGAGWASMHLGPTEAMATRNGVVEMPILVALMLTNRIVDLGVFGALVISILVASSVSRVRGVNLAALFGVAGIMGVDLAPMAWLANYLSGLGMTMTSDPVRDAFLLTASVFVGATGYIFVTRRDFSYLRAGLSMGALVVFVGCVLSFFLHVEIFALAICSVGAIVASGLILYQTSYIFRQSDMDDPVGDALGLLIQVRNLVMFLMRIFMSRR